MHLTWTIILKKKRKEDAAWCSLFSSKLFIKHCTFVKPDLCVWCIWVKFHQTFVFSSLRWAQNIKDVVSGRRFWHWNVLKSSETKQNEWRSFYKWTEQNKTTKTRSVMSDSENEIDPIGNGEMFENYLAAKKNCEKKKGKKDRKAKSAKE